jgi:predicted nucleic-acid-binding protein
MLAIDTNVIVRYLLDDDPEQSPAARRLIDDHEVFIPTTVFLETEWVLRSSYRLEPSAINTTLRQLAGLPTVTLENPPLVAQALAWFANGLDFADALHKASSAHCEAFYTFDRNLVRSTTSDGVEARRPA